MLGGPARGSLSPSGAGTRNTRNAHQAQELWDAVRHIVRVGFGKLVDELVQNRASGGILAISNWKEKRGPHEVTVSEAPVRQHDTSYQRHGFVGMESDQSENIRFADFEGVVDDLGDRNQMAVYRVTLPSGGLDRTRGRSPAAARAGGPLPARGTAGCGARTEISSGEYSAPCCVMVW